jgi:crotonobetainyl-CoA:carnitine CoA-transferase CaiB-like acyl-CoA transferase
VARLVDRADVVIENFRVGALRKFGLDYDTLRQRNPRAVYCSVTGFGQEGPYAERAGYDAVIQGMSGFMDLTGDDLDGASSSSGSEPWRSSPAYEAWNMAASVSADAPDPS